MERHSIKQVFFVIDTSLFGKKLIYSYPNVAPISFKSLSELSLYYKDNHEYFGLINKDDMLGFKPDFLANFFTFKK